MATITTPTTSPAWRPDITVFPPAEVVPDSLILRASTVVTTGLDGDAPVARIAWVEDDEAQFVPEGAEIPEAAPSLSEVVLSTAKVAQLLAVSREQYHQASTAQTLSQSVGRAVRNAGDRAFLNAPAPTGGNIAPQGILTAAGSEFETPLVDNLDVLAEAIGLIETVGGTPSIILTNPTTWAALRTLKTATGANTALLGAGVEDQVKRLLGIEVATTQHMPAGKLAVIDRGAIASAVGPVQVATSEHRYFESDSVGLRCTWRVGWKVMRPERISIVTVA